MGILLAYSIHSYKNQKVPANLINVGWMFSIFSFLITSMICVASENRSLLSSALYSSVASITCCCFIGWIIFAAEISGNVAFMEWKLWKVLANLSYAIYLVQFVVFQYNIGVTRSESPFSVFGSVVS
jgi:peptidoglycan/LPS O-acetylase OafA/YrhL